MTCRMSYSLFGFLICQDNIRDREEFKNKRAKALGDESRQQKRIANRSSYQHKKKGPSPSFVGAPTTRNKCKYNSQNSVNFRARPAKSQSSMAQGGTKNPACAEYGRNNSGICRDGSTGCFKYGQNGHFMRECPKNKQGSGNRGNRAQSSSVAPPDKAAPRGATSDTGNQDSIQCFVDLVEHPDSCATITGCVCAP
ncbi:uncharacterized protein LOC125868664 [Solanum stenotomum]|uniref:uncharacterized protein LOC125868664 n=1 Tax=Solanum stenotomum TaxID=172797 RepID=UPI0020D0F699|nr:uncharacterized protein LOC125868664 [Solanum stenotomum]